MSRGFTKLDRCDIRVLDDGRNTYGDYRRIRSTSDPMYQVDLQLRTTDHDFIQRLMAYFKANGCDVPGGASPALPTERSAPALTDGIVDGVLEDE